MFECGKSIERPECPKAITRIARRRLEAKELWEEQHERVVRSAWEQLAVGDLVLVKIVQLDKGFGRKLDFRWLGPYEIVKAYSDRNYYQQAELDSSLLKKTTHGDRLKKYFQPNARAPAPDPVVMDVEEGLNAKTYDGPEGAGASEPVRRSGRVV